LVLLIATAALAVQLAFQWDLGIWIIDQGRDVLWAESIAAGQRFPQLGPAASGVQLQGPVYYLWMGALRFLGIAGWWVGIVLAIALLAQAALLFRAAARHGQRRGVLIALGLSFGHVGIATLLLTPTNPSWLPLLGAAVLAVLAGADRAGTARRAALRYFAAGCLWMVAVEFHVSALVAAPALAVATLLPPRRFRASAVAGLAVGAAAAFLTLSGSLAVATAFVKGLFVQQMGVVAGSVGVRLANWIVLPWRLAGWWWRQGALGTVGLVGAVAHWGAVLLGVALAAVAVKRTSGPRRVWLLVLLVWAGGGLVYPVPVRTTAFYYLVGALPALYLAAGGGLARRRWSAWLGVAVLVAANVALFEFGHSLARDREWRVPAFALWWADSTLHLPTLRSVREAVDSLSAKGFSYECAVREARGGRWVAAMMDGGVLASRLLPGGDRPCPPPLLLLGPDAAGHVGALPLWEGAGDGWRPAPVALQEATETARPALRPFAGTIVVPGDGLARRVSVLVSDKPPDLSCGVTWEPLGLGRYQVELTGASPCRIVGNGGAAWVDIAPLR